MSEQIEKGVPLIPELNQVLFHGSSIGGARSKALIQNQGRKNVTVLLISKEALNMISSRTADIGIGN